MFGGRGYDGVASLGQLSDLWQYSPGTNQWTWQAGSKFKNASGVYGTLGVPNSANSPGARFAAACWTDPGGNFWLYGGNGYDSVGNIGDINDLWEFSTLTLQWTWKGGSNLRNAAPIYGTKGVAAPTNSPGARHGAAAWSDTNGNLWLFAGNGNDSLGVNGLLNDVWQYSTSAAQWAWKVGSPFANQSGQYSNSTAYPGGRSGATIWSESGSCMWMLGGYGDDSNGSLGYLNDTWKICP